MLRRMVVERIEHRILIGTTAFLGIMVLVGWIAINEGGRMASFDQQFLARSIERGGGLFIANCAECHGPDARGTTGVAPGLNNPQLFGHDFLADLKTTAKSLTEEETKLMAELNDPATTDARKAEINARLGTGSIAEALLKQQPSPLMEAAAPAPAAAAPATAEATAQATGKATAQATAQATVEATALPTAEVTTAAEATPAADATAEATPAATATTEASAAQAQAAADLQALQTEQTDLQTEKTTLQTEFDASDTTDARKAEITARIAEIDARLGTGSIPADVLAMEATHQSRVQQMGPAVTNGYNPDRFDRMLNTGWGGGLRNFVHGTLVGGRPVSASYWPRPMPNWSQVSGGPLREDQIDDVVSFILNFDKGDSWTIEDLNAVNQFAVEPAKPGEGGANANAVCASCTAGKLPQIVTDVAALTGDPVNGQALYTAQGCGGCHLAGVVGPQTAGTWTRIQDTRLQDPALAGFTGEQYIIHSILFPSEYVVPNFTDGIMPHNFGDKLSAQDLADLVAFLKSQDQPAS